MQNLGSLVLKKSSLFKLEDRLVEDVIKKTIKKALKEALDSDFNFNPNSLMFKKGVLFLNIDYSTAAAHLYLRRNLFLKKINEHLGQENLVKDLRFIKGKC